MGADLPGQHPEVAGVDADGAQFGARDLDVCLFSVGTAASRELVPYALAGGAVVIDKSAAFRLQEGVPLVVPEVNGARALEHSGIIANPNCSTIILLMAVAPLRKLGKIRRVVVSTYQAASGAGAGPKTCIPSTLGAARAIISAADCAAP